MKLEKINKEEIYNKKTILHEIEINGKYIAGYEHILFSDNETDYDFEWNNEDLEKLTEDEVDYLDENELEILD